MRAEPTSDFDRAATYGTISVSISITQKVMAKLECGGRGT
jgi:hypothetical protein